MPKISELPAGTAPTGTESFPAVQGVVTSRFTLNQVYAATKTLTNTTYDTAGTGNSFLINGLAATANTGTGAVVRAASPTITGHPTIEGVTSTGATGTGNLVFSAAPTFTGTVSAASISASGTIAATGAITGASFNGNFLTAGTYTLTGTAGKTFTFSNTMTLAAGADGQTFTFPSATGTVAVLNAANVFTNALNTFSGVVVYGDATAGINFQGDVTGFAQITGINTLNNAYNAMQFFAGATVGLCINTDLSVSIGAAISGGSGNLIGNAAIRSRSATAGIGYATGAGGAITQGTSRVTGVTLNTICGAITLFAAAPAVGTWVSFTVTNSAVAATDVPHVSFKSGTNTYIGHVTTVAAGSFQISFTSIVGTASDSPVINFDIIKGVVA